MNLKDSSIQTTYRILVDEIEDITNMVTRYEVEDVTPPPQERQINEDAIHIFPLSMYQTGTLNITGNSTADKTASPTPSSKQPAQQDKSTAATDSMSGSDDNCDNTETSVADDSSSHTTEHQETPNPSPETVHELYSQGSSPSTEGGNNHNPSTTFVIKEEHLYDFLQDDMSDTESNTPVTTMQPPVSPPHQQIFQSILSDQS